MSTDRDAERDQLVEWLHASGLVHSDAIREWCECQQAADALLPVVDRIATERAAAELRAAACEAMETTPGAQRVHVPVSDLFDRAAALHVGNGEGATT